MAKGLGGDQVEGRQAVRELLSVGLRRTREVWLAQDLDPASIIDEIQTLAEGRGVPIRRVSRSRLESVARTDSPQGVLAHAAPIPAADFDELCREDVHHPAFLVALDGVTDPHNLGAVLRSACAAGATGAVLPRHRSVHITPAATKAAAGAVEHLRLSLVPGLPAALAHARESGVWTVGLDAGASKSIFDLEVATEPIILVLGSEGTGLGRLTRARCDLSVRIPLKGAPDSLNVAAAAAVACFEVARRRDAG